MEKKLDKFSDLKKENENLRKENERLKLSKSPSRQRWDRATDEDRKTQGEILKKARLKKYKTLSKEQKSALMKAIRKGQSYSDLYKIFLYENNTKKT